MYTVALSGLSPSTTLILKIRSLYQLLQKPLLRLPTESDAIPLVFLHLHSNLFIYLYQ